MTEAKPPVRLVALRGATTTTANSAAAIRDAVGELLDALMERNQLRPAALVSILFSVTADLDALFPASIARHRPGWENVALLDTQQMKVQGDLPRCIRLFAHAWLPEHRVAHHPYLRAAAALRPDRR